MTRLNYNEKSRIEKKIIVSKSSLKLMKHGNISHIYPLNCILTIY